ncbi:MAG TPA: DUF1203 domain-containing protein [Alphaproteobacteria bacterium]|nr:DUF1203 domain-containing protein [Alphaproteobacteria bacterium]HAJ46260.1 DUF1203 domain-containing protein [Alphaproteobacteria bacterium]
MSFHIRGLDPAPFRELYGLSDAALAERHIVRMRCDTKPGYPDRVTLADIDAGGHALLLNYTHQPAATPYRAAHAIFVQEGAETPFEGTDVIPEALQSRLLSLRAFDGAGMMIDADIIEGREAPSLISRLFDNPHSAYIHAHFARRGCFAARIERA